MPRNIHACFLPTVFMALCGCGSSTQTSSHIKQELQRDQSTKATEAAVLIVAMGDSLTEGLHVAPDDAYPAQLERRLRDEGHDVRVINAGISGETSSGAAARVDWVLKLKPDIIILETGANDGLRGIDPQVTRSNIERLVTRFRDENVRVILAGMQIVQNMGQPYIDEFRAIYPAIAESHDIPLIPFFLEGVAANPAFNQPDGIHPTAEGYSLVAENVLPVVSKLFATEVGN